jgi:hypothetical protein
MDGTLDIWDFVFKQNEPALTVQVSTLLPQKNNASMDSNLVLGIGLQFIDIKSSRPWKTHCRWCCRRFYHFAGAFWRPQPYSAKRKGHLLSGSPGHPFEFLALDSHTPFHTLQMLEREAKREKTTEGAARERRLRMQKRPNSSAQHKEGEFTLEELITKAEEDFFQITSDEPDQVISNMNKQD